MLEALEQYLQQLAAFLWGLPLVFLLVGPMFVSIELAHKLGLRRSGVVN